MSFIEGGLVSEVVAFPRGDGWIAVRATWTGINWKPPIDLLAHHVCEDMFIGTWKVVGVETMGKLPRELVVILEPDGISHQISRGDILIFGRGAISRYASKSLSALPDAPVAVEVRDGDFKGVLAPSSKWGEELIVFHDPLVDIGENELGQVREHDNIYELECTYINTIIGRYTIEFKLSGKAVTTKSVIDLLQPVRGFVIGASEEICLNIPRTRGRRAEAIIELFEPTITLKAASVRFRLHPSSSPKAAKLDTSKALKLLSQVLRAANAGDEAGIMAPLKENLKGIEESLNEIEAIVKVAIKQKLEFNASDSRSAVYLGNRALSTIQAAARRKTTTHVVQGDIYGLDDNRNWCRISTSNTEPQGDWKLKFSEDLRDKVRGKIPRRVEVEFDTDSPEGSTQGNGVLFSIKNI